MARASRTKGSKTKPKPSRVKPKADQSEGVEAKGSKAKASKAKASKGKPGEVVATIQLPPTRPLPESDPRMQRKRRTERWLAEQKLPFIDHLPPIAGEGDAEVRLRSAEEVARRVRVLFAVSAVGYHAYDDEGEKEVVALLKCEGTWAHATPRERRFLSGKARSKQAMIDATWTLDAIWPLLWALGRLDDSDPLGSQRTPGEVQQHVPPVFDPIEPLLAGASLRPLAELLDETDRTYRLHWAARPWREPPWRGEGLCSGSLRERHRALNWLTGYADAATWDDVDTDT